MKALSLSLLMLCAIGAATRTASAQTSQSSSVTARGCIVREVDGYYLVSPGERQFLNWNPEVAQGVNHMAIVEGRQQGQANNTYAGATGQNTIRSLHVTKVQRLPQSCGSASIPAPPQNPNSTYSSGAPRQ